MNHVTYPLVLLTSAFFHRELANFVILRNTDILHFAIIYIISNFLKFLEFLDIFFNKPGYNFDNASKNSYPKLSLKKDILRYVDIVC